MIGVVKIGYERSIKGLERRSKGWGRNGHERNSEGWGMSVSGNARSSKK
jgi:hypothetical protein